MALKNLQFKSMEVRVLSYRPEPRILVSWELNPTTQNLKNLFFFIDRGESPSNLVPINQTPIPYNALYEYVDMTGKMRDLEKFYYYQIRAVEFNPAHTVPLQTFKSKILTWEGELDITASYIIEEHIFAYEEVFGMPTLIFKKKREGTRCPVCFDTVLKRVTKSNCTTCLGTGFVGGYYSHIEAWMDFNPDPKVVSISEFGEKQPSQTDVSFTNYPLMHGGDIIVELSQSRYWRVENIRNTEKNRTTILQVMRLDEINRSDVEYEIVVPEEVRARMLAKLHAREKRSEFG